MSEGFTIRDIPWEGEVGAGRLLPFIPKGGTVSMAVPNDIPDNEPLGTLTVRGPSLEDVGILDGDVVLCRKIFSKKKITPDTVCIVYIHATGEVVAKKVAFFGDMVRLLSCGGGIKDIEAHPDAIEIRGIIIGLTRHREEWPFVGSNGDFPF